MILILAISHSKFRFDQSTPELSRARQLCLDLFSKTRLFFCALQSQATQAEGGLTYFCPPWIPSCRRPALSTLLQGCKSSKAKITSCLNAFSSAFHQVFYSLKIEIFIVGFGCGARKKRKKTKLTCALFEQSHSNPASPSADDKFRAYWITCKFKNIPEFSKI